MFFEKQILKLTWSNIIESVIEYYNLISLKSNTLIVHKHMKSN